MKKGASLFILCLCCFLAPTITRGATSQTSDDLWDLRKGVVVTATSGTLDSSASLGMLGGAGFGPEPGTTIFGDVSPAFVEWQTTAPVTIGQIRLFASGDGNTSFRAFGRFTLMVKSEGSSTFDQTILSWVPDIPFVFLDQTSWLVLDTNFTTVTAREFRAEFELVNGGPRIMELDGFPAAPVITGQPVSIDVLTGGTADFSVNALGYEPLTYTWKHAGTNVFFSPRIQSDGPALTINDVDLDDAGEYRVVIQNAQGQAESLGATLTVSADSIAPVVAITAPITGTVIERDLTLAGTVVDNGSVASIHWELNGVSQGDLTPEFSTPVRISTGENRLKVIAIDHAGNAGSAEVLVTLSPNAISDEDLWDVTRGAVATSNSGVLAEPNGPGLLGGGGYSSEPGSTIFTDGRPDGFVHFVEWKTQTPVAVSSVRVFAGGDGEAFGYAREFERVTLKVKSGLTSGYDVTVFTYVPGHPYPFVDAATFLVLETNLPVFVAQDFRAEFEHINLRPSFSSPRVVELDAFGPVPSGPPQIINEPISREAFLGANTTFLAGVLGATPLTYQWRHKGTNLTESARFVGVNTWRLTINDLVDGDAGAYSVFAQNALGEAVSQDAQLTLVVDATPPIVTITSPAAGEQPSGLFTIEGTAEDANGIKSARWELNGRSMGALALSGGLFRSARQLFDFGENLIRVIVTDRAGNETTTEVTAEWRPTRVLALSPPPPVQEGARIFVPVTLVSAGGVSGATFTITFDTNFLADAQFEWADAMAGGFNSVTMPNPRQYRISFLRAGQTFPAGNVQIAMLSFRTRSVSINTITLLRLGLVGIYDESGNPYTQNNLLIDASPAISKRKFTGDNNANDRLDVGDGTVVLRLALLLDPVRPWDRTGNDLNKNSDVDLADVTKVLRAVVGLDPQPNLSTIPVEMPNLPEVLVADKMTAPPGEKVTVEVRITESMNGAKPISGASFRLDYPVEALKLDDASAHSVGSMVPGGAVSIWNVSPGQNNYETQDGSISLAISSAAAWPANAGTLARFTFTVQPGATDRYGWRTELKNLEVSRNGFETDVLGQGFWVFTGHEPNAPDFAPTITFSAEGEPTITLNGDVAAQYLIEASSDLKTWTQISTQYATNGVVSFEDPLPGANTTRFYKASLIPNAQ